MDRGPGGIVLEVSLGGTLRWKSRKGSPGGGWSAWPPPLTSPWLPPWGRGRRRTSCWCSTAFCSLSCSISVTGSTQESWGKAGWGCGGAEFWAQVPAWPRIDASWPLRPLKPWGSLRNHLKPPVQDTTAWGNSRERWQVEYPEFYSLSSALPSFPCVCCLLCLLVPRMP